MYKVEFTYYFRNPKNRVEPIGTQQKVFVYGETIAELNKNIQKRKESHDVFKYTQYIFQSIEEVK